MGVQSVKDLTVCRKSYKLAMRVFQVSKRFPKEEVYALTSQIRRSSRSVPQNHRAAWAKRRYPAHFVSKLTDCDGENGEIETSLDFARDCSYISVAEHSELAGLCAEVGKMLGSMIQKPDPFLHAPEQRPPAPCPLPPDS